MWLPLKRFKIIDRSMEPALLEGDYVIVNRLAYLFREPKIGEIIVFKHPTKRQFLVKRIVNKLKNGLYIVTGDNTEKSLDSRSFGPIRSNSIVGKVSVIVK